MSKFLTVVKEVYRVDSEEEAKALIEEAKNEEYGDLVKYNCEYKKKMSKGELIDSWYRVTLEKIFNDEKAPDASISLYYDGGIE